LYNDQQPTPERLWKAFPLQQQTTPRQQQQPTTQPPLQQPAGQSPRARSQRRDRSQAPWLWILVGTGVGLGAMAALVASSVSKSRRTGNHQRAAPRRSDYPLAAYRSGLMWLAGAVVTGLAIGWLAGQVG
jgi:hypothetical protein